MSLSSKRDFKMQSFCVDKKLERTALRVLIVLTFAGAATGLVYAAATNLIAGSLADPRKEISRDALTEAARYLPGSSGIQSRLADTYLLEAEPDLNSAQKHAENAVRLSPFNYAFRQQLALVQEMQGDRAAAEESLRAAVRLSSSNLESHWRLANLLVRSGKLSESYDEFRPAIGSNKNRFNSAIDLAWRASGGSVAAVEAVTPETTESKLALAKFLLNQSRFDDAIRIVGASGNAAQLPRGELGSVINALIAAGLHEAARSLWLASLGAGSDRPIIWNGGFESSIERNFSQFDWTLTSSEFARVTIDQHRGHTGAMSLRIDFTGRDTTRLAGELRQPVLVRPGAAYILECWVKTQSLIAPEGPQIAVIDGRSSTVVAATEKIEEGSNDWRRVSIRFIAPQQMNGQSASCALLNVGLRREPRYSYDEPMRGTIWLDDFAIREADGR